MPKLFYFYDKVIVPKAFYYRKILWHDYGDTYEKVRNDTGWPEISSVKKGVGDNFQLICFFNEDH